MGFKAPLRITPSLENTRCTFPWLLPSLLSRSIITSPSGNRPPPFSPGQIAPRNPPTNFRDGSPSSSSPSSSSPSSSPSQRPPRGAAPRDLDTYSTRNAASLSDSSRHNLIRSIRKSAYAPQNSAPVEITQAELERRDLAVAIAKQNTRRWKAGDVYAPHDLSSVEMQKWRKKRPISSDAFAALDLDPRKEYKNYSIMREYVSKMGRIKHPRETGLGNVNQRRLAKAIRRSIGMGLMPSVHNHPEVLEAEAIKQHAKSRSWR